MMPASGQAILLTLTEKAIQLTGPPFNKELILKELLGSANGYQIMPLSC